MAFYFDLLMVTTKRGLSYRDSTVYRKIRLKRNVIGEVLTKSKQKTLRFMGQAVLYNQVCIIGKDTIDYSINILLLEQIVIKFLYEFEMLWNVMEKKFLKDYE